MKLYTFDPKESRNDPWYLSSWMAVWAWLLLALIIFIVTHTFDIQFDHISIKRNATYWPPIVQNAHAQSPAGALATLVSPTPTPSEHDLIVADINQVFGSDAPKAFKLLSCENHALNPRALNDNTTWGGVGQDIGVFQINTIWQGVSNKAFLTDYDINIRLAYSIYSRDNHSFKLWTCGRQFGL